MPVQSPVLGATYQGVLGAVIAKLRVDRDVKQADIADHLALTVSTWSRIERGESALNLEQLIGVAEFFQLRLSDLFRFVEDRMDELGKQGIVISPTKEGLAVRNILQLSPSQLISMMALEKVSQGATGGAVAALGAFMAAGPIPGLLGLGLAALKKQKADKANGLGKGLWEEG